MTPLAVTAAKLLSPDKVIERPLMLIEDGKIAHIGKEPFTATPRRCVVLDFAKEVLAPGFIDLHIHGGLGFDFMNHNIADNLPAIERSLACHGVTSYFPTTVSAPLETTLRALERLADEVEARHGEDHAPRARPVGIHLEGPFLSHARRGVHPSETLQPPTLDHFEQFWQAARGHIRMMTIAPELPDAVEVIAAAAQRGVCVSMGHSDADSAAAERGLAGGARHATHTFNAMRPFHHRNPGIVGTVLNDPRVSADIIADGVHVDPAIVKLFANAKGANNTVLITDATAATGMPDGRYCLGPIHVEVKDGRCTADGKLAGSVLTMDQAIRNLAQFADWPLELAVAAATRNPARVAGLMHKGALVPGADADFTILSPDGHVEHTFIGGVECEWI